MRNADLSIEEEEAEDLLKEIEKQLKKRQWGQAIRLEVETGIDKRLLDIIRKLEKLDIISLIMIMQSLMRVNLVDMKILKN